MSLPPQPGAAPSPASKKWKYLENPTAPEWLRGRLDVRPYPNLGDFAVLSIDPVASVGHLDRVARQAASLLPIRKYVVLVYSLTGLPVDSKPTHPYRVYFVRKGVPEPRLRGYDSAESCIAILPDTHWVAAREPLRPAHPLPWENCYLDATYGFPFPCRVTSIKRDYTPVLPVLDSEVIRVKRCFQSQRALLNNLRREHGDSWREPLDLVEATPLSPIPEVRAAMQPSDVSPLSPDPLDGRASPPHDDTDHVSIIASDDGSEYMDDGSDSDSGDSEDLDMLLNFENMMLNAGELHDPVVNVWYDLDVVEEIVDPVHFLADVKRLRIIIDEAEIRLSLRPALVATELGLEQTDLPNDDKDPASPILAQSGRSTVSSPMENVPQEPSSPCPPKFTMRLRVYLCSVSSKLSNIVRNLARRLIPAGDRKRRKSRATKP